MGRVAAPFGVQGWLKIHAYTEAKEGLLSYPAWWLGENGEWRQHAVAESSVHGKALLVRLEGCDDRTAAEAFKGLDIAVSRSQLPTSGRDEFYWADLVGLKVVNRQNQDLGEITGLLKTGANEVLQVKGERERLIPFIASVIIEVDLSNHRMLVDWGSDF